MYVVYTIKDTLRVPPKALGQNLNEAILAIAREEYEGLVDEDLGVIVSVVSAKRSGEGRVVPGDGAIYFEVNVDMLVYKPTLQEVVEGYVTEVTEFGAFIRTGPVEGLVHVSQIMDDYINYDAKNSYFVGKETGKKLKLDDDVLARTVTVSLKGAVSSSKIGFTMRQLGLGKKEWLKIDEKREKKEKEKKEKAKKKEEKKKK